MYIIDLQSNGTSSIVPVSLFMHPNHRWSHKLYMQKYHSILVHVDERLVVTAYWYVQAKYRCGIGCNQNNIHVTKDSLVNFQKEIQQQWTTLCQTTTKTSTRA